MAVHHCQNKNVVALDRVENCVGKNPGEAATNILIEDGPGHRRGQNALQRVFDAGDEPVTQADLMLLVVSDRELVLGQRLGVKLKPHLFDQSA